MRNKKDKKINKIKKKKKKIGLGLYFLYYKHFIQTNAINTRINTILLYRNLINTQKNDKKIEKRVKYIKN